MFVSQNLIIERYILMIDIAGTVTSLEALNEPAGFANDGQKTLNAARQYYYGGFFSFLCAWAWARVKKDTPNLSSIENLTEWVTYDLDGYNIVRHPHPNDPQSNLLFAVHDAFQPLTAWSQSFPASKYQGTALDTHIYTVFSTPTLQLDDNARVEAYCSMASGLSQSNSAIWTFVGEFSPAPTDCAPRLNGQGIGARYDGSFPDSPRIGSCQGKSGSSKSFSGAYKTSLARFFEVQTSVYETASGWFMWTFKTEDADDWSYDAGVKVSLMIESHKYKTKERSRILTDWDDGL